MTRREFLGAMTALFAAIAVDPLSLVTPSVEVIPWTGLEVGTWHSVEYHVAPGVIRAFVDGRDVSANPRALTELGRYMCVDTNKQAIRFGASGLGAERSGFIFHPPDVLPDKFSVGFCVKVKDVSSDFAPADLDNLYVTETPGDINWRTDALGYARTTHDEIQLERGYDTVRIEAYRPSETTKG